ncbi:carbohydrate esterase family 9 [Apiospora arundinis]
MTTPPRNISGSPVKSGANPPSTKSYLRPTMSSINRTRLSKHQKASTPSTKQDTPDASAIQETSAASTPKKQSHTPRRDFVRSKIRDIKSWLNKQSGNNYEDGHEEANNYDEDPRKTPTTEISPLATQHLPRAPPFHGKMNRPPTARAKRGIDWDKDSDYWSEDGWDMNDTFMVEAWDICSVDDTPVADQNNAEELSATDEAGLPVKVEPPTLAERTRLYDRSFDNEPSTHIHIPSAVTFHLVEKALNIVKKAVNDFCRQYQPRIWREEFACEWFCVRLDYYEIEDILRWWVKDDPVSGVTYKDFASKLRRVKHLRNMVCRYTSQQWFVTDWDSLLRHGQGVAVAVKDEAKALQIRSLRDKLRVVAAETLREIEEIGFASLIPIRREWEVHHEIFFEDLLDNKPTADGDDGYQHPPAVLLAFEAWKWQQESYPRDHPLVEGEAESLGLFD